MPKTVKVRIAVAVDDSGDWNSSGWKRGKADELEEFAREPLGDSRIYWLTAELEVPEQTEVAAAVELGASE